MITYIQINLLGKLKKSSSRVIFEHHNECLGVMETVVERCNPHAKKTMTSSESERKRMTKSWISICNMLLT